MNCSCCKTPKNVNDLDNTFDLDGARKDARHYRKHGLDRRMQKLVGLLNGRVTPAMDLLEVGGGAGALQHDLLRQGAIRSATGIDASSGYLTAARENADHFGLTDKVTYCHADFALDETESDSAELVVLDRVICCYPYLDKLLGKAATHATRLLAITYPVDRWYTRWVVKAADVVLNLFGSGYHPFVHPQSEIDAIIAAAGLRPVAQTRHQFWQIALFERAGVG